MRPKKEINKMIDEHMNKKQTAERTQTYQRKRKEFLKIEKENMLKGSTVISRPGRNSFFFGVLTVVLVVSIIGFVFATTNLGQQLDMGNNQIKSLATPTVGTDAATKDYVDSASIPQGAWMGACVMTTALCGGVSGYPIYEDLPGYGGNPSNGCNRNCYCSTGYTMRWSATSGIYTYYVCIKD